MINYYVVTFKQLIIKLLQVRPRLFIIHNLLFIIPLSELKMRIFYNSNNVPRRVFDHRYPNPAAYFVRFGVCRLWAFQNRTSF